MSLAKNTLIKMAQDTAVFKPTEITVLEELLQNYQDYPDKDYSLVIEEKEGVPSGFIILGRTPMTEFSWDIYWLVVDPALQGQGIAGNLIRKVEEKFHRLKQKAVFRVETSSKDLYAAARKFYVKAGFCQVGTIRDFYASHDDLIIYTKTVN
jgi:ribosomal protein S18 acetylase RimI-like enzyme